MTDVANRVRNLDADALDAELAGLDALEFPDDTRRSVGRAVWSMTWPKLAAIGVGLGVWYLVIWSNWKPKYLLPWPHDVLARLWTDTANGKLPDSIAITMQRAASGFALAVLIGGTIGVLVSRWKVLRVAIGSFITGLQTMPSIAWFPLAILLFKLSEGAITFVLVLGAAPAIANGVISGSDQVSPLLLRGGKVLGAKGFGLYRTVTFPASVPSLIGGLKQGWAFAWRSLLAGELLVIVPKVFSIGARLQNARDLFDVPGLQSTMIVILIVGILVDAVVFGTLERIVRKRWGLVDPAG